MSTESNLEALVRYYRLRAPDYEDLYYRPEPARSAELALVAEAMRRAAAGRRVIEVACGTGYWTAILAGAAARVVAVDVADEMLDLARRKNLPAERVELRRADAYRLDEVPGTFDAGVANFWLSHVPRAKMNAFLDGFHRRLGSGALVFMTDNLNVPGYGGEFVRRPGELDTFKRRDLPDGSYHDIIKNYYTADALERLLAPAVDGLTIESRTFYWWLTYRVRSPFVPMGAGGF